MIYLTEHDSETTLRMEMPNLTLPNTALVRGNTYYFGDDPVNGIEFVDLGLPSGTLWAATNIGAEDALDYGKYYQWADVDGYTIDDVESEKKEFVESSYKYYDNSSLSYTKYNSNDELSMMELSDDASHKDYGGFWTIPTADQVEELFNNCSASHNEGYVILTAHNGNTISIPYGGYYDNTSLEDDGNSAYLWTADFNMNDIQQAFALGIVKNDYIDITTLNKFWGANIRPVLVLPTDEEEEGGGDLPEDEPGEALT